MKKPTQTPYHSTGTRQKVFLKPETIKRVAENIPDEEINHINNIPFFGGRADPVKLRGMMAMLKLLNPICNECGQHDPNIKLLRCGRCEVVHYCNVECQKKNWPEHKKKCKKRINRLIVDFR